MTPINGDDKRRYFLLEHGDPRPVKGRAAKEKRLHPNKVVRFVYKQSSRRNLREYMDHYVRAVIFEEGDVDEITDYKDLEDSVARLVMPSTVMGSFETSSVSEIIERGIFHEAMLEMFPMLDDGASEILIFEMLWGNPATPEHPPTIKNADARSHRFIHHIYEQAVGRKSANKAIKAHVKHREELLTFMIGEIQAWWDDMPEDRHGAILSAIAMTDL